jgi:hypothetical protein
VGVAPEGVAFDVEAAVPVAPMYTGAAAESVDTGRLPMERSPPSADCHQVPDSGDWKLRTNVSVW